MIVEDDIDKLSVLVADQLHYIENDGINVHLLFPQG